ncbi:MAG: hypothetical protein WB803_12305, partial [Pseudolabrys sp.]
PQRRKPPRRALPSSVANLVATIALCSLRFYRGNTAHHAGMSAVLSESPLTDKTAPCVMETSQLCHRFGSANLADF